MIVPNALSVVRVEAFTWPARGCRSEVKSPTPIRTREVVSAGMGALCFASCECEKQQCCEWIPEVEFFQKAQQSGGNQYLLNVYGVRHANAVTTLSHTLSWFSFFSRTKHRQPGNPTTPNGSRVCVRQLNAPESTASITHARAAVSAALSFSPA